MTNRPLWLDITDITMIKKRWKLLFIVSSCLAASMIFFPESLARKFTPDPQIPTSKGLQAHFPLLNDLTGVKASQGPLIYSHDTTFRYSGLVLQGRKDESLQLRPQVGNSKPQMQQSIALRVRPQMAETGVTSLPDPQQSELQALVWEGDNSTVDAQQKPRHSVWANFQKGFWHVSFTDSEQNKYGYFTPIKTADEYWIVSVIDFKKGHYRLYVNGERVISQPLPTGPGLSPAATLYFGRGWEPVSGFVGVVGNISIWNRALAGNEVKELYLAASQSRETLHWMIVLLPWLGGIFLLLLLGALLRSVWIARDRVLFWVQRQSKEFLGWVRQKCGQLWINRESMVQLAYPLIGGLALVFATKVMLFDWGLHWTHHENYWHSIPSAFKDGTGLHWGSFVNALETLNFGDGSRGRQLSHLFHILNAKFQFGRNKP